MDANEITVAASGNVHVAPFGTTLPTDPTEELAAAFVDLGYISEDGATFNNEPTVEDIMAWQKLNPVRRVVTGRATSVTWQGMQWNRTTFAQAFGGGDWTEPSPGVFRYLPPADSDALVDYTVVLDAVDGDKHYRWIIYRVNITDAVETQLVRGAPALLPVTAMALTPDDQDRPWEFLTDDPAFDLVGS